jgi:hypothetical protein
MQWLSYVAAWWRGSAEEARQLVASCHALNALTVTLAAERTAAALALATWRFSATGNAPAASASTAVATSALAAADQTRHALASAIAAVGALPGGTDATDGVTGTMSPAWLAGPAVSVPRTVYRRLSDLSSNLTSLRSSWNISSIITEDTMLAQFGSGPGRPPAPSAAQSDPYGAAFVPMMEAAELVQVRAERSLKLSD